MADQERDEAPEPVAFVATPDGAAPGDVLVVKPSGVARTITHRTLPWVAFLIVAPLYEVVMLLLGRSDGTLTHLVKMGLGVPGSLRHWLLGAALWGFTAWLGPHFMIESVGLRALLVMVGVGLAAGVVGWLVTR